MPGESCSPPRGRRQFVRWLGPTRTTGQVKARIGERQCSKKRLPGDESSFWTCAQQCRRPGAGSVLREDDDIAHLSARASSHSSCLLWREPSLDPVSCSTPASARVGADGCRERGAVRGCGHAHAAPRPIESSRVLMMLVEHGDANACCSCVLVLVAPGQVEPYAGDHERAGQPNAGEFHSQNNEIAAPMNGAVEKCCSRGCRGRAMPAQRTPDWAVTEQPSSSAPVANAQRWPLVRRSPLPARCWSQTSHQPLLPAMNSEPDCRPFRVRLLSTAQQRRAGNQVPIPFPLGCCRPRPGQRPPPTISSMPAQNAGQRFCERQSSQQRGGDGFKIQQQGTPTPHRCD